MINYQLWCTIAILSPSNSISHQLLLTFPPSPSTLALILSHSLLPTHPTQFGQYAWTHMICLVAVLPSSFFVSNIFESGLLWFVLPAALIILNDVMAYFFGFFFGK